MQVDRNALIATCTVAVLSSCVLPTRGQVVDTTNARRVEQRAEESQSEAGAKNAKHAKHAKHAKIEFAFDESSDRDEGTFCRKIRPVTRELRATAGRHLRCIGSHYVEAGYFGNNQDLAAHSFYNACFHGIDSFGDELRYYEQPIPPLQADLHGELPIGSDSRLDISLYGMDVGAYTLERPQGVTGASIRISFEDPVVRTSSNLGKALLGIEMDAHSPPEVRNSAAQCREYLCREESIYTSEVISAQPKVTIELKGGTASSLRPVSLNGVREIVGTGTTFSITPSSRVNLAARFEGSRDALQRNGSCGVAPLGPTEDVPGWTPPCSTAIYDGIHVKLKSCSQYGDAVECKFSILSPRRDRTIRVIVGEGSNHFSSLVDEAGAIHEARLGNVGDAGADWVASKLPVFLVADVPAAVSLEFVGVALNATRISRATITIHTDKEFSFDFRGIVPTDDERAGCEN